MLDINRVIEAAQRLYEKKDDVALELLVAMREKAIQDDPTLKDNVDFEPKYEAATMGGFDELKSLGKRIVNRWNKELYSLVCAGSKEDENARQTVLDSLNLSEVATIAAVTTVLLSLGLAAAIAAALAPLLVRRFIWPAGRELCDVWKDSLQ